MQLQKLALYKAINIVIEVLAVLIIAILIPIILVASVILAVYGDVSKKRNRWTGFELPDSSDSLNSSEAKR